MSTSDESELATLRREMTAVIAIYARLIGRDHLDERVLATMANVPRHEFVPAALRGLAYVNGPLPIGYGKTISQPFIVALMTDLLAIDPVDSVLEVGTGLGYQTAILSEMAERVFTIEIIEELAQDAHERLDHLGYRHVDFRVGDGARGWPEHAPFDKIIVTAAAEIIPPLLVGQLKPGGRMVIPIGGMENEQELCLVTKDPDNHTKTKAILPVKFGPLVIAH